MKILQNLLVVCVFGLVLTGCQAANYVTHEDCDADRDGDFAVGECGGNDCDDQDNRRSSLLAELCGDGIDNNCNNATDRMDPGCICNASDPPRDCYFDQTGKKFTIIPPPGGLVASTCRPGQQQCVAGTWGPCLGGQGPLPEICDTKDNDCDGVVDNGFNVGKTCSAGTGSCNRPGTIQCNDQMKSSCNAEPYSDSKEFLLTPRNGSFDNNCDGKIEKLGCTNASNCGPFSLMPIGGLCDSCLFSEPCTWKFEVGAANRNCGDMVTGFTCDCAKSGFAGACTATTIAMTRIFFIGCR